MRLSAWLLILSSLVAAATMVISMLPVLDTQGLLQVATWHRWAGLVVVVSAVLHLLALGANQVRLRSLRKTRPV